MFIAGTQSYHYAIAVLCLRPSLQAKLRVILCAFISFVGAFSNQPARGVNPFPCLDLPSPAILGHVTSVST